MPIKNSFIDNGSYQAADLNNIYRRLMYNPSAGQVFSETGGEGQTAAYEASHLNALTQTLCSPGVISDSSYTLKAVKLPQENKLRINPGTAVFEDGTVMDVEPGGHELAYLQNVKNYVYLKQQSGECFPVCGQTAPATDGSCIPLAEISESGKFTDRRPFAKCKNNGYASNAGYIMNVTVHARCEERIYPNEYFGQTTINLNDQGQHRFAFAECSGTDHLNQGYSAYSFCDMEKNTAYAGNYYFKDTSGHDNENKWLYDRMCIKVGEEADSFVFCKMHNENGLLTIQMTSTKQGDISFSFLLF